MDTDNTELQLLQDEIRKLRAELEGLRQSVPLAATQAASQATSQATSQDSTAAARDFASELQAELKKTLDSARERSHDLIDQARDQGDKAIDQLEKKIEQYPLMALLLVFLAGLLLGKLFERRQ